jgi:hypothetical protein
MANLRYKICALCQYIGKSIPIILDIPEASDFNRPLPKNYSFLNDICGCLVLLVIYVYCLYIYSN